MKKTVMALSISVIMVATLNAQVGRNDVIKAYNDGATAMKTDPQAAIKAFETAVSLADQVGQEAADLKEKAVKVIPGLYVKVANNMIAEKKPAAEIIKSARTAAAVADKYGNATAKENAGRIMVKGYSTMASDFFAKNDFDNALKAFDSVLIVKPDYNDAIYNKALIYMKQDNAAAFEESIDIYIEKLKAINDTADIKKASAQALGYFRSAGSKANQANKTDDALALYNKAEKYGADKDLFYYLSDVYNKQKNFDKGAEYAQKGLDLETGDAQAKAKYYYQLGFAQMNKGQTAEACASFKNSLYGAFEAASKAHRTNLKCGD